MSQDIPTIVQVHVQFEHEWERLYLVYGRMLAPKTLKVVKGLARNIYLQGRIDGMCFATDKHIEVLLGKKGDA